MPTRHRVRPLSNLNIRCSPVYLHGYRPSARHTQLLPYPTALAWCIDGGSFRALSRRYGVAWVAGAACRDEKVGIVVQGSSWGIADFVCPLTSLDTRSPTAKWSPTSNNNSPFVQEPVRIKVVIKGHTLSRIPASQRPPDHETNNAKTLSRSLVASRRISTSSPRSPEVSDSTSPRNHDFVPPPPGAFATTSPVQLDPTPSSPHEILNLNSKYPSFAFHPSAARSATAEADPFSAPPRPRPSPMTTLSPRPTQST